MLPKPEKKSKKTLDAQQLDLVEAVSSLDKTNKKRKALLIALFFTMGLSLIFALYTRIRLLRFTDLSFSLPKLSLNLDKKETPSSNPSSSSLEKSLESLLPSDKDFSLYVRLQSPSLPDFSYSHQPQYLFTQQNYQQILADLEPLDYDHQSILASLLPQGVNLQQQQLVSSDSIEVQSLITIPQRQILIITRTDPTTSSHDIDFHASMHEKIYWLLLKQS